MTAYAPAAASTRVPPGPGAWTTGTARTLRIERSGQTWLQDLGREGYSWMGVPAGGAADQHAARTANILVANAETSPLLEVTGSELTFSSDEELLVAGTGAADQVLVDGHAQPAWQPLHVHPGARVSVLPGRYGLRSYVAVNGAIACEAVLGGVAPDPLLGVGRRLEAGDRLVVRTRYRSVAYIGPHAPLFRFHVPRPDLSRPAVVHVTPGPELDRMSHGKACLSARYEVSAQSDHIGLRLVGDAVEQRSTQEILSRGVPVGAVEVVPTGELIVLLRGRLVTAGYPVVGIVASAWLDRLGQLRPGDSVAFSLGDVQTAVAELRRAQLQRLSLAGRVFAALHASGLGELGATRTGIPAHDPLSVDVLSKEPQWNQ